MKKNWTKIALAIGSVIIIASVAWEFARVNPQYNYLIQPWSLRGHETDQGTVFVTLGILTLLAGLATAWEGSVKPLVSGIVSGAMVIGAVIFAFVFTNGTEHDSITITVSTVSNVILSLLIAAAIAITLRSLLRSNPVFKRALPIFVVLFVALFLLIGATVAGEAMTLSTWIVVLIVLGFLWLLTIGIQPSDVAANRMMIVIAVGAWAVVTFSAGAVRQALIDAQLATDQGNGVIGFAAQYKDTQAAAGWWLAGFGTAILFVGAVGLWAKRRDIVAAIARARKQRAAAEESSREIQEALEAYEAEQAQKAAAAGQQQP